MKYVHRFESESQVENFPQKFNIDGVEYTFPLTITYYKMSRELSFNPIEATPKSLTVTGFEYGPLYIWGKEDDLIFFDRGVDVTPHYDYVTKHKYDYRYNINELRRWIALSKKYPTKEQAEPYK
jgi:hypothetical protein